MRYGRPRSLPEGREDGVADGRTDAEGARTGRAGVIAAELEQLRILKEHELGVRLEHPPEGDPPYVVQVEE